MSPVQKRINSFSGGYEPPSNGRTPCTLSETWIQPAGEREMGQMGLKRPPKGNKGTKVVHSQKEGIPGFERAKL